MFCENCGNELTPSSKFCSKCGLDLQDGDSDSPKRLATKSSMSSICPVCSKSDLVQKVSVIVDGGTSTMVGLTSSVNVVGPNALNVGGFAGVQSSNLASRLQIAIPSAKFRIRYILLGTLIGAIVGYFLMSNWVTTGDPNIVTVFLSLSTGIVGMYPGLALGVIWAFVARGFEKSRIQKQVLAAHNTQEILRNCFYCLRDDFMFSSSVQGSPDELRNKIFTEELQKLG